MASSLINGASRYRIYDDGTVLSRCSGEWIQLNPRAQGGGGKGRAKHPYLTVAVRYDDGKMRERRVHHLVAEHFIGPRPPGCLVLHRDDNNTNNWVSNLYYGTISSNSHDAGDNRRGTRRLSRADVQAIRKSRQGCTALGDAYNVNRTTIYKIKTRKSWKALGDSCDNVAVHRVIPLVPLHGL